MNIELLCTGWYSSPVQRDYITHGDESIRSSEFRELWWKSIDRYVKPKHVLVVDSASPIKPDDLDYTDTNVRTIELLQNPGHSQNCSSHYCGAMAAIITGMEYALFSGVDTFIYIEQDALIYGDKFIARVRESLKLNDLVFGDGGKHRDIEQTVIAANTKGIRKFLSSLHEIQLTDRQVPPELKFMWAASSPRLSPIFKLTSWDNPKLIRRTFTEILYRIIPLTKQYGLLPFGYGRMRPINFSDPIFYFQQGSAKEIEEYRKVSGF